MSVASADHLDGAEDGPVRATADAQGSRRLRQQVQVEGGQAVDGHVDQDGGERDDAGDAPPAPATERMIRSTHVRRLRRPRPGQADCTDGRGRAGRHSPATGPATRQTRSRAMTFMMTVITSRTRPSAIRLEVCDARPGASLNVVAIFEAIVWVWSNRRLRDRVPVADDHRHRHRLAERPAETEDDRADDAGPGERHDRAADDLPARRTEREHRLTLRARARPG